MKIAITGGIGSGKSTLRQVVADLGYPTADADSLAREVLHKPWVAAAIENLFGPEVFLSPGQLNRAHVRALVFANESLRKALEEIMHPAIAQHFESLYEELQHLFPKAWLFYEVPLLFETQREGDFSASILVTASQEVRLQRLSEFRGLERNQALAIMAQQMDDAAKKERATFILENSGTPADLLRALTDLLPKLAQRLAL